jgi:aquaporin Z
MATSPAAPKSPAKATTADAPTQHSLTSTLVAEAFGTFLLVFAVIGTALFSDGSYVGIALAVGFAVAIGIYSVGHISGGHFNPAVSLGLALAGRFSWARVLPYSAAQIVGAVVASSLLFLIASGGPKGLATDLHDAGFASNGFGDQSIGNFGLIAVILTEVIFTAILVYVVLSVTDSRNTTAFAPLVIGITLTIIHLVAIPISGASVNPARSIATALYGGPDALAQLVVFIIATLLGAAIAGLSYKVLFAREK